MASEINAKEWKKEGLFVDFVQVNEDKLKEHYEDDTGWVEDAAARLSFVKAEFNKGCDKIFDEASAYGCSHCEYCEHNEGTPDAFGTGDSPTMYECKNDEPSECPQVIETINNWFD